MLTEKTGNIFTSNCNCIVNAVNCTGVMGAGIALELKLRYPEMFNKYEQFCINKQLTPGKLWLYREQDSSSFNSILAFPTKNYWKHPSRIDYVEQGLIKFVESYEKLEITSIAFPLLGVGRGGLSIEEVMPLMEKYLSSLPIEVEIWHYDSKSYDDLMPKLKKQVEQLQDISQLAKHWNLTVKVTEKIVNLLRPNKINSMAVLLTEKGIGEVTISKLIQAANTSIDIEPENLGFGF